MLYRVRYLVYMLLIYTLNWIEWIVDLIEIIKKIFIVAYSWLFILLNRLIVRLEVLAAVKMKFQACRAIQCRVADTDVWRSWRPSPSGSSSQLSLDCQTLNMEAVYRATQPNAQNVLNPKLHYSEALKFRKLTVAHLLKHSPTFHFINLDDS